MPENPFEKFFGVRTQLASLVEEAVIADVPAALSTLARVALDQEDRGTARSRSLPDRRSIATRAALWEAILRAPSGEPWDYRMVPASFDERSSKVCAGIAASLIGCVEWLALRWGHC